MELHDYLFLIPEIEEHIAEYLNPRDLMNLILVNKYCHELATGMPIFLDLENCHKKNDYIMGSKFWNLSKREKLFANACRYNCFNLAKFLYLDKMNVRYHRDIYGLVIKICCEVGNLKICKWLYSFQNININHDDDSLFRMSCRRGRLEIAQWLYHISINEQIIKDDLYCQVEKVKEWANDNKYHSLNEWIQQNYQIKKITNNKIDIHAQNNQAFRSSCENGHLEVAKYVYSLGEIDENGTIDIHVYNDEPFRKSCANGHLEVAQFIYSFGKVNIHADNDFAFIKSCENNHVEIVQWLISLDGFQNFRISDRIQQLFEHACMNNHLGIAKYLFDLNKHHNKIDIRKNNDDLFKKCYELGILSIIKLLISYCPEYELLMENDEIVGYCIKTVHRGKFVSKDQNTKN